MNNGFNSAEVSNNARQMANMQQAFAAQTAMGQGFNSVQSQLAQCCCDNRAATQDVKYTIATEACSTRAANSANTQAILDKLCQLELDSYKQKAADQAAEIIALKGAISQTAQTAQIIQDNNNQTANLIRAINPAPIPAYQVPNPVTGCCGNQGYYGCGCAG